MAVVRRLDESEIDRLAREYEAGRSLPELAAEFGVHRRTIAKHLESRGTGRRVNHHKLSHDETRDAIHRHHAGETLASIARTFDVHAATVRREIQRAKMRVGYPPGQH
jgi:IS30 family transposase